ncbi:MAG: hypothetical protein AAF213_07845 [Pseudomonadota bacterium]
MYPVIIITFLTATLVSLTGVGNNLNPFAAPASRGYQFEAASDGHGAALAEYISGIQRMVSFYRSEGPAVYQEILDEITANGGTWTIRFGFAGDPGGERLDNFLAASPAAAGVFGGLTRDQLFPPNYEGRPAWRVTLVGRQDAAGALLVAQPDYDISAVIGWADPAVAPMTNLNIGGFMGGFSRAFEYSTSLGINRGGSLVSQVQRVNNFGANIINIPNVVPNGAPVYVQCRTSDQPGADGIPLTGDDANDGFCE